MKTKFLIPIFVLSVVISCKQDKKSQLAELRKQRDKLTDQINTLEKELGDSTKELNLQKVSVIDMQYSEFKHFIEVQGKLDGEDYVDVAPEGVGVIEEIYVSVGQEVVKGQSLARLNDAAIRDQLKALETQYKFVKETYEKQQKLWDQKVGSEIQYLQSKTAKEQLESQLSAVHKQLDMYTIKAPISGTVEEVNAKVGQMASAANPIPPFRVINFTSIKVKAEIAEAYSQKIKVGDNVQVYFPDLDREITAKISTSSRFINPSSRTFTVEARLNPDKNGFKANMIAILKINDYSATNSLVIPINYIQTDPKGNFVYIIENKNNKSYTKKAFIEQGQSYNGNVEILKGLNIGDKVVTSGYLDLEEGENVVL
jgi:membrane fusion protein, multidrug efflux system